MTGAELLAGRVMHRRLRPVEHRFEYGVFFLRLPLTRLEACGNALFGIERRAVTSFRFCDHGARDGTHPLAWIRALLAREALGCADGEVWLHTFPRVLGYVFNPVSFWFCEDRQGRTRAILAEVSNTFGEHHAYLLCHADTRPIGDGETLDTRKVFHVSPFFPVAGCYRFRFSDAGGRRLARIDYEDEAGKLLLTSLSGTPGPLDARAVAQALLRHPMMTLGVIARIHWQALRLWLKRVPFFSKPTPPAGGVTR